jgi:pimeloyl-ACP methyl ester carboxylesterase
MKFLSTITRLFLLSLMFFPFSFMMGQEDCDINPPDDTITIVLPAVNAGITEVGFPVPPIWNGNPHTSDVIEIPNGRPIYALIVSGYASNAYLDEMMLYNFARYLMDQGAYVHYSWWNNLLAPYMERPLHSDQSHPGSLSVAQLSNFLTRNLATNKALPGEDYQFVADAKIMLTKIRENNPNAIIIVAGHSMGGGAITHLASETNELIDILAPIDPVGNRNLPFAGVGRLATRDFNWTRWRVSRDGFRGYRQSENTGTVLNPECTPAGPWLDNPPFFGSPDPLCSAVMFTDTAPTITFGSNIINLHHRYQQEAAFPFDFYSEHEFGHNFPLGGSETQEAVVTHAVGNDTGGWPLIESLNNACCPSGQGVSWINDGHGEIVGYRGEALRTNTVPLGVRLKTSPQCGSNCSGLNWPSRTYGDDGTSFWFNGNGALRVEKLTALESVPYGIYWPDSPYNPSLCLVSNGLINLYPVINKPPTAHAGDDQVIECTGPDYTLVTLDGSASTDPENDVLTYTWIGGFGTAVGAIVDLGLPFGTHCIKLTIEDLVGHIDIDWVIVDVVDTTGPELTVSLNPELLWPPNHRYVDITATVEATDLCGTVESILLDNIVVSEADLEIGSGHTSFDVAAASYNTEDLFFKLRAERSGRNRTRVYTITYKATDNSGNATYTSADVVVENPSAYVSNNHRLIEDSPTRNYPNPFSSSTDIEFYLSESDAATITVYNLMGKEVAILDSSHQKAGINTVTFDGSQLPSGIYFYRITSKDKTMLNKMVIRR